jgi:hypothetical protein
MSSLKIASEQQAFSPLRKTAEWTFIYLLVLFIFITGGIFGLFLSGAMGARPLTGGFIAAICQVALSALCRFLIRQSSRGRYDKMCRLQESGMLWWSSSMAILGSLDIVPHRGNDRILEFLFGGIIIFYLCLFLVRAARLFCTTCLKGKES